MRQQLDALSKHNNPVSGYSDTQDNNDGTVSVKRNALVVNTTQGAMPVDAALTLVATSISRFTWICQHSSANFG